jgi:uncharacterized protein YpmB
MVSLLAIITIIIIIIIIILVAPSFLLELNQDPKGHKKEKGLLLLPLFCGNS